MAETPFPPPDPSGRVPTAVSAERALLEQRLARLAARRPANPAAVQAAPRTAQGRRHPAARARMAALGLSIASTAGLVALFASSKSAGAGGTSAAAIVRTNAGAVAGTAGATSGSSSGATTTQQESSPATTQQQSSPATPSTAATTVAPNTSTGSSTVVDGGVFANRWGDVQVEATFDASGALVDVVALQYPDDRSRSIEINDYAIPRLTAEALAGQSASIDSISGATYTSGDYMRSLQSAIDAARDAGATSIG